METKNSNAKRRAGAFRLRVLDAATMFVVSGLSLLLLIYIGFGEAQRTYQQFHVEKITAQAKVVQSAVEKFLRPGLPLKQYVGFATRGEQIIQSDGTIAALSAYDETGNLVFVSGDDSIPLLSIDNAAAKQLSAEVSVRLSDDYVQVVLPLRNRFETVGSLAITMPRLVISDRIERGFEPLLLVALALSLCFALFVSINGQRFLKHRMPWLQIAFAATFVTMSVFVIGTLISIYSDGTQVRTKALADSLGQRLFDIVAFNLNLGEIYGLDRVFGEYLDLNPDISAAGLTIDGVVKIHSDPNQVGNLWLSDPATYEYVVDLTPPNSPREIRVAVSLPTAVVYRQTARSVKNFAALFVASAFLAGVFLQLAASMQRFHASLREADQGADTVITGDTALDLVKPVFLVAVLVEHLTYAFLPQFIHGLVAAEGLPTGYAAAPFMCYYLFFAITLVPAGYFSERSNPRPLIYWGLVLAAAGMLFFAYPIDFGTAIFARSLSGIGQGMLFIGVQSYILAMASPGKKTQGAGIIVFGFQGGMISGMAIGSLLVTYIGPSGVFLLGGGIAVALAIYAILVVPIPHQHLLTGIRLGETFNQLSRNTWRVLGNFQFVKTMLLIGIPTKAVLTGVVIFALPLILAKKGYLAEDIGQIIMVYAAGVVLASRYMSRLADHIGKTRDILFWGSLVSGFALMFTGLIDWHPVVASEEATILETVILISGVAIIGIGHGFINAPVVTHVADSELAQRIGESSLTAIYRFLERIGHIAGPIIIGQLFMFGGQNAILLTWIGGAIVVLGFLFLIGQDSSSSDPAYNLDTREEEMT